jgi:hypothetical protein
VRKNPRNELGGRFPGQTLRHAGMMNANRKQSGERTEKARGNGFLQRWS